MRNKTTTPTAIVANARAIEVIKFHADPSQLDLGLGITPDSVFQSLCDGRTKR
jgi:hypothetical protein